MSEKQWFFVLLTPINKPSQQALEELSKEYVCVLYRNNILEIWFKDTIINIPQAIYKVALTLNGIESAYIATINTPYKPLIIEGIYNRNLTLSEAKPPMMEENTILVLACYNRIGYCLKKILEHREKIQLIEATRTNTGTLIKVKAKEKISIELLIEKCMRIKEPLKIPP